MSVPLPARLAILLSSSLLLLAALSPVIGSAQQPLDTDIPNGHFYTQTNGQPLGSSTAGYAISNDGGVPFWDAYQALGGPIVLGYPATGRFIYDGFVTQAMQKAVFQWRPDTNQVGFLNTFDALHDKGKDDWLLAYRQTPKPFDTSPDTGLSFDQVVALHLAFLDQNQAIKSVFLSDPSWLDHFGLPVSYADEGNSFVIRAQRATFQYWKQDVPWAKAGDVTVANGGDLAKESGLWPASALALSTADGSPAGQPRGAESSQASPPGFSSHDWRTPGFVSAVGGRLYDPQCVPLLSVGTNVPNLPFREGLDANLEWMRQHHLRWMRVYATGHDLTHDRSPVDVDVAITALRSLLARVDAFNSAHDPSEAVYVLVSLTDYYPPGVPGDRYAYDHPTFTLSPVLPAPWFRAGVRQFDFEQEHNFGRLTGLPNYEVYYKPWVLRVVSSLADSRSLMGWQLGNELKARGSPRNGITVSQAYSWYLAFTSDIVDSIRSVDRNHLIVTGTQYIAEEVDWEYRPKGELLVDLIPEYSKFVQQTLDNPGEFNWNVMGVTSYDFNPYPLDDASAFGQAGVAVLATEYGFTRGTPAEAVARFGGDQAAAVRGGLSRPWKDVGGHIQPRMLGPIELVQKGLLAGLALWGSSAPGPTAWMDEDAQRGITDTPEGSALWAAWGDVGAALEASNSAAGPSAQCTAHNSATAP